MTALFARLAAPSTRLPTVTGRALAWFLAIAAGLLALGLSVRAQIEGERGIAPIASSGDYEVGGIRVVTTGKNAEEARRLGWEEAQRQGWQKLWAQMRGGGTAPALSDSALNGIVSAIVVEREMIGPRRYIARLGVLFDRARAGQILGVSGTRLRSAPLLVIPVTMQGGAATVFERRTDWQRAWARFRTADSAIDYVRPNGAGIDSILVNAGQMGRRSRVWWRLILDEFGAADVIMPIARLERQWPGGPVTGTFSARYGPDSRFLGSFTMTAASPEELPAMLDRAVLRFDALYTGALGRGLLRPDPTLIIEQPVPEEIEAIAPPPLPLENVPIDPNLPAVPPPAAVQSLVVQFVSPDADAVAAAEASVRGVAGVQGAFTSSLALGGTSVMQVRFAGDLATLAAALEARGWRVQQGVGALRIER